MSRYIDADAFVEDSKWCGLETAEQVLFALTHQPSVDIVRCRECKWLRYCETEDLDLYLDCDKPDGGGIPQSEEWFCADGEREDQ